MAPATAIAGAIRNLLSMFLSGVMRQPIKLQPVMRRPKHLAAITAMGLAVGLIVVPLDAAPRRFVPVPRPRPVTAGDRSLTPPAAAAQNRDQKQPSQADDAAQGDEACLARLRAADIRFDIPTMPVAAKAACAIEVPVRLKSVTTRARAVLIST